MCEKSEEREEWESEEQRVGGVGGEGEWEGERGWRGGAARGGDSLLLDKTRALISPKLSTARHRLSLCYSIVVNNCVFAYFHIWLSAFVLSNALTRLQRRRRFRPRTA